MTATLEGIADLNQTLETCNQCEEEIMFYANLVSFLLK